MSLDTESNSGPVMGPKYDELHKRLTSYEHLLATASLEDSNAYFEAKKQHESNK